MSGDLRQAGPAAPLRSGMERWACGPASAIGIITDGGVFITAFLALGAPSRADKRRSVDLRVTNMSASDALWWDSRLGPKHAAVSARGSLLVMVGFVAPVSFDAARQGTVLSSLGGLGPRRQRSLSACRHVDTHR